MPSHFGISGSGVSGGTFILGPSSAAGSALDGTDSLFGPMPTFGTAKFDEARKDDPANVNFYYKPITVDTAQFGEYHGYIVTSAVF